MIRVMNDNEYYELISLISMFKVFGFLWNEMMMIYMNCCGYVVV